MTGASCPLPDPLIQAYFASDLEQADADAVEDHAFSCESCASRFEQWGAQAAMLRALMPPVISRDKFERLVADGVPLRVTPVDPGPPVEVEFAHDLTYLVHALRGDLRGASQVDVEVKLPDGTTFFEFAGVPFDPDRGEVLIACQRHFVDLYPPRTWFRVVAVVGTERREVGDYLVDHSVP